MNRKQFWCNVEDCKLAHYCRGFCRLHYGRFWKHGDPLKTSLEMHGMHKSPTYKSYRSMIARCENKTVNGYESYGGRGIKVCDRWRHSFLSFLGDMGKRPTGKTLDRIDNDGNYEPGNCRWATLREQQANRKIANEFPGVHFLKRTNKWQAKIGLNGKSKHLGTFGTKEEAVMARTRAERIMG